MMASLSGTLATMGPGVPYAIAAKFAHPDRPVIALVGDGAMQMNGLAELITIAKYRERWSDQRLIVLVLNNRDLNQVTWEQRAMSGDPKFVESQELPDVPYARWAELLGLNGIRTDDPDAIGECWDQALAQRSADRAGGLLRSRGAAAAAAHHARAGPLVRLGGPARRPRQPADHRPVAAPEAARVPARPMSGRRLLGNLRRGRAQRTLAAATALSALPLGLEIYFEHFRGSFGDKWMWTPVALSPLLTAAGLAGVRSQRAARTVLPAVSALYCLDGLIGVYTHVQGVRKRPGGFSEPLYNIVMGPPLLAPGSLALVGGMGLAAALADRER